MPPQTECMTCTHSQKLATKTMKGKRKYNPCNTINMGLILCWVITWYEIRIQRITVFVTEKQISFTFNYCYLIPSKHMQSSQGWHTIVPPGSVAEHHCCAGTWCVWEQHPGSMERLGPASCWTPPQWRPSLPRQSSDSRSTAPIGMRHEDVIGTDVFSNSMHNLNVTQN